MVTPAPATRVLFCLFVGMLAAQACVYDHQLLERASVGGSPGGAGSTSGMGGASAGAAMQVGGGLGGGGSAGAGVGAGGNLNTQPSPLPWTEASCLTAVATGASGDRCNGTFKCVGSQDCCETVAVCTESKLELIKNCALCVAPCSADSDCKAKEICENNQCRECPALACYSGWSTILRNQCAVCVPPNGCKADVDCGGGELKCFAGASCLPNCKSDPACCFGNQCGTAACGSPADLDCTVVGCGPGMFCKSANTASACKCSSTGWVCSGPDAGSCITN